MLEFLMQITLAYVQLGPSEDVLMVRLCNMACLVRWLWNCTNSHHSVAGCSFVPKPLALSPANLWTWVCLGVVDISFHLVPLQPFGPFPHPVSPEDSIQFLWTNCCSLACKYSGEEAKEELKETALEEWIRTANSRVPTALKDELWWVKEEIWPSQ